MLPQRSHGTVASIVYVKVIFHECPMTHCRESAYTILSIGWCPFFLSSSTLAGTGSAAEEGQLRIIALCFLFTFTASRGIIMSRVEVEI
jgi:hypothetical protein